MSKKYREHITGRQTEQTAETKQTTSTRSKVGMLIGLAGITAIGTGIALSHPDCNRNGQADPTHTTPASTEAATEAIERTEVQLGNIRLYLKERGNLSNREVNQLFTTLSAAYNKLKENFGEDVMTREKPIDCPILFKPKTSKFEPYGMVRWESADYVLAPESAQPSFTEPKTVQLILRTLKEDTVAHELVHLFMQMPITDSHTFHEGHAHAIQTALYGETTNKGGAKELSRNPDLRKALTIGLDDNQFDRSVMNAGVQNNELINILKMIWEDQWLEYLKKDPEYFKKFYRKVSDRKKAGAFQLSKDELLKLSEEVSPGFMLWFSENAKTMANIDEAGRQTLLKAIVYPDRKTIVVINIQTDSKPGSRNYRSGMIEPLAKGPLSITFRDRGTHEPQTVRQNNKNDTFFIVDIENGIPANLVIDQLIIGDRQIPVVQ